MRYYCSRCWAEIPGDALTCPQCGADLTDESGDVVERYIAALRHPVPDRAGLACAMLAELGDPRAVAPLVALIESRPRDFELLGAAVKSLQKLHAEAAIPALRALLQDEQAMIPARLQALEALVSLGGETADSALDWADHCERPSLQALSAALRAHARPERSQA